MLTTLTLDLPFPPSVNSIWRAGRGRVYRSPRYQAWRTEAGWELARQRPARISGPVSVMIAAGAPDHRRRDLDNLAKATSDLLAAHRIIEDDSLVRQLSSRWSSTVPAGRLRGTCDKPRRPHGPAHDVQRRRDSPANR